MVEGPGSEQRRLALAAMGDEGDGGEEAPSIDPRSMDARILPVCCDEGSERWRSCQETAASMIEQELLDWPLEEVRSMITIARDFRRARITLHDLGQWLGEEQRHQAA